MGSGRFEEASLGFVPFGGVGQQVLDAADVLAHGTPEARRGLAVGLIVGGVGNIATGIRALLTTGSGSTGPQATAPAAEAAPTLPPYAGDKTSGVLRTAAGDIALTSGYKGPSAAMPRGTPGMNGNIKSHVEAHAASIMRQQGLQEATLYINRVPCSGSNGCGAMLSRMLPEGARLRVIGPNGYDQVFVGLPD